MIISVFITKGGVGKTTIVSNLAAEYSIHGKSVLVVDLDTQGNATLEVSSKKPDEFFGSAVFDMIRAYGIKDPRDYIHKTPIPKVDIIPSSDMTDQLVKQLPILSKAYGVSEYTFLRNCLKEVEKDYDVIIIDTPPARNTIVTSALCVSDYVITPLKPEQFCLDGLSKTLAIIKRLNEEENLSIKVLGILLSIVENTSFTKSLRAMMQRSEHADLLFEAEIRKAQLINESTNARIPAVLMKRDSNPLQDFEKLYKEIQERIGAENG